VPSPRASNSTVEPVDPLDLYPLPVGGRTFEETAYGFTGSASESRSGDAMGQHLRVLGAGGANMVRYPSGVPGGEETFALVPFEILGTIPRLTDSRKTVFRPDRPCERQEPPNLEAGVGSPPEQAPAPRAATAGLDAIDGPGVERLRDLITTLNDLEALAALPAAERRREVSKAQRLIDRIGLVDVDLAAEVEEVRR